MSLTDINKSSLLATAVPFFALLVAPLGVAGQNIGLGLGLLCFIALSITNRGSALNGAFRENSTRQFMILWALIILPITISTVIRRDPSDASSFFWGYVFVCFSIPAALSLRAATISRRVLLNLTTTLVTLMGLVAASQFIFGWKFEGPHIVEQIKRAQGFYSHPLTFAYCGLVIMPWCLARVMAKPRQWQSWLLAGSIAMIIIASQSVTVISVTAITTAALMMKLLPLRQVIMVTALGILAGAVTLATPNPIQKKFHSVLSGQRGDRETPYPDDRMAFWHAHGAMFLESPIVGHGTGMNADDRRPYYAKIGLPDLKRPYEAHNMFLQYAVEGGIVPALALAAFLIWWFLRVRRDERLEPWYRLAMMWTPLAFALGGLTQNAIQDSEVRYLLILTCASCLYFLQPDSARLRNLH